MKKTLSILLLLSMLLIHLPAASAAPGDMTLLAVDPDDKDYYEKSITTVASEGDTLYIIADGQLLTWKAGDAEPTVLLTGLATNRNYYNMDDRSRVVSALYIKDGVITALDTQNGQLFTLSVGEDGQAAYGEPLVLEMDSRIEEEDYTYLNFQFEDHILAGDTLLVSGYDFEMGGSLELYAWDAVTGKRKEISLEYAESMCAYKDGKILCVTGDRTNMYDSETRSYRPWTLAIYDPATDEVTEVAQVDAITYYDVRAMAYDEATDTLYLGTGNKIFRMAGLQNCELAAYHPAANLWGEGNLMAVVGTQVAIFDEYGLYIRTADPAQLPDATLSIYGYYASDEHVKAMAQMGDIPVFFSDSTYFNSAQELGQALSSGENQLDLLYIQLDWIDFTRLMEKGYCYDLSGSQVLSDFVADLYPFMQEAVMQEGKLLAVPLENYAYGWHYNKEAFAELGLSVPDTYLELFEQLNAWADESNAENWEEYAYMDTEGSYKGPISYDLFSAYEQYMLSQGETLTLDNDVFRSVMTGLDSLDTENVEVIVDWSTVGDEIPEEVEKLWNKTMLTSNYYNISPYGNYDMKPLRLRLTEECGYVLPAHVSVMFVNPRSQNLEAAVQYLEALVKAYQNNEYHMIALSPNHNEPVLNEYYEENLASMQEYIAEQEAAIAKADPIDKPVLQEELDSYKEYILEYTENERYSISEENIAEYRAEMEYAVLARPSVMSSTGDDDSFFTLRQRYLDGQIKLEQFIQEGGSKLRLMQLENQ